MFFRTHPLGKLLNFSRIITFLNTLHFIAYLYVIFFLSLGYLCGIFWPESDWGPMVGWRPPGDMRHRWPASGPTDGASCSSPFLTRTLVCMGLWPQNGYEPQCWIASRITAPVGHGRCARIEQVLLWQSNWRSGDSGAGTSAKKDNISDSAHQESSTRARKPNPEIPTNTSVQS
jgi:hypothetical protein